MPPAPITPSTWYFPATISPSVTGRSRSVTCENGIGTLPGGLSRSSALASVDCETEAIPSTSAPDCAWWACQTPPPSIAGERSVSDLRGRLAGGSSFREGDDGFAFMGFPQSRRNPLGGSVVEGPSQRFVRIYMIDSGQSIAIPDNTVVDRFGNSISSSEDTKSWQPSCRSVSGAASCDVTPRSETENHSSDS